MTIRLHERVTAVVAVALAATTTLAACSVTSGQPNTAAPSDVSAAVVSSAPLPEGFPAGSWHTAITADDLAAVSDEFLSGIGMSRPDLIRENSGTFTTTLGADGTWSTVQDSDQPVRWPVFRGTFLPVGEDAFDQHTTFPPDFAGEVVRFTWRVEDGLLHLAVPDPPDPILRVITEAHAWTRVD